MVSEIRWSHITFRTYAHRLILANIFDHCDEEKVVYVECYYMHVLSCYVSCSQAYWTVHECFSCWQNIMTHFLQKLDVNTSIPDIVRIYVLNVLKLLLLFRATSRDS